MNYEEHKQWLNSLKVGDEVAIHKFYYGSNRYSVGRIKSITPKRTKFVVEAGASEFSFNKNGNDTMNSIGRSITIVKLTDSILNTIKLNKGKYLLNKMFSDEKFINSLSFDDINNAINSVYKQYEDFNKKD